MKLSDFIKKFTLFFNSVDIIGKSAEILKDDNGENYISFYGDTVIGCVTEENIIPYLNLYVVTIVNLMDDGVVAVLGTKKDCTEWRK